MQIQHHLPPQGAVAFPHILITPLARENHLIPDIGAGTRETVVTHRRQTMGRVGAADTQPLEMTILVQIDIQIAE